MTENEFERYQNAVEIKEKIDILKKEIEYIDEHFDEFGYPRTESDWRLSINLNSNIKFISLTSELFWECVNLVKMRKLEELKKYQDQFDKL
jgi:hypothetical protein